MRIALKTTLGRAECTRKPRRMFQRLPGSRWSILLVLLASLLFALPNNMFAQAKPGDSLDEELMRKLSDSAHDPLDGDLFGPETPKQPDLPKAAENNDLQRAALRERLEDDSNPVVGTARRMFDAGTLLRDNNGGPMTQNLQDEVLADLDRMIKAAKKERSPASGPNSPQPVGRTPSSDAPKPEGQGGKTPNKKPTTASSPHDPTTPARQVDPAELRSLMKHVWGDLPQRAREQVMQLPAEAFLPKYETLIEDYFRRLSDSETPDGGPQR